MAKRKSINAKTQTSSKTKPTRSGSNDRASSPSGTKAAPKDQAEISSIAIGHAAGEIWALLSSNGEQTLPAIKKSVDAPSDVVLAAIGWLAREDKLDFTTSGRTVRISLR